MKLILKMHSADSEMVEILKDGHGIYAVVHIGMFFNNPEMYKQLTQGKQIECDLSLTKVL